MDTEVKALILVFKIPIDLIWPPLPPGAWWSPFSLYLARSPNSSHIILLSCSRQAQLSFLYIQPRALEDVPHLLLLLFYQIIIKSLRYWLKPLVNYHLPGYRLQKWVSTSSQIQWQAYCWGSLNVGKTPKWFLGLPWPFYPNEKSKILVNSSYLILLDWQFLTFSFFFSMLDICFNFL